MSVDALSSAKGNGTTPCLPGKDAFLLYDSYGFPVERTKEVAGERSVNIDMNSFDIEMENQRCQWLHILLSNLKLQMVLI